MKTLTAILILAFLASSPGLASRIECITTETTETVADGVGGTVELSATAIRLLVKNTPWNIEIYTTDQASVNPQATCTGSNQVMVTCNGFDTSASAEIWWKCDRAAPYQQMENTTTYTAPVDVGRVQSADCLLRLRIVDDGATNSVCFTFGAVGAGLDSTTKVDDEKTSGAWAVLDP